LPTVRGSLVGAVNFSLIHRPKARLAIYPPYLHPKQHSPISTNNHSRMLALAPGGWR